MRAPILALATLCLLSPFAQAADAPGAQAPAAGRETSRPGFAAEALDRLLSRDAGEEIVDDAEPEIQDCRAGTGAAAA